MDELLSLKWADVSFDDLFICVRGNLMRHRLHFGCSTPGKILVEHL